MSILISLEKFPYSLKPISLIHPISSIDPFPTLTVTHSNSNRNRFQLQLCFHISNSNCTIHFQTLVMTHSPLKYFIYVTVLFINMRSTKYIAIDPSPFPLHTSFLVPFPVMIVMLYITISLPTDYHIQVISTGNCDITSFVDCDIVILY